VDGDALVVGAEVMLPLTEYEAQAVARVGSSGVLKGIPRGGLARMMATDLRPRWRLRDHGLDLLAYAMMTPGGVGGREEARPPTSPGVRILSISWSSELIGAALGGLVGANAITANDLDYDAASGLSTGAIRVQVRSGPGLSGDTLTVWADAFVCCVAMSCHVGCWLPWLE
jgi:hypothetical protein